IHRTRPRCRGCAKCRCYGLSALYDTSCAMVAACLFSCFLSWLSGGWRRQLDGWTSAHDWRCSGWTGTTGRTWAARWLAIVTTWAAWLLLIWRGVDDWCFAGDRTVALVDPDLDADDAVGGRCFAGAVVDISAQGVQWHTAFAVPFGTCDFDAVQAARRHDLDADGAQAHCILHCALHGATEHDALFELLRDRIGDQLRIDLWLADLFDVDVHGHAHDLRQRRFQHFDVFAFFTDHDTRTRRVNGEACILGRTLDDDAADRSVLQLLFQESTGFQ